MYFMEQASPASIPLDTLTRDLTHWSRNTVLVASRQFLPFFFRELGPPLAESSFNQSLELPHGSMPHAIGTLFGWGISYNILTSSKTGLKVQRTPPCLPHRAHYRVHTVIYLLKHWSSIHSLRRPTVIPDIWHAVYSLDFLEGLWRPGGLTLCFVGGSFVRESQLTNYTDRCRIESRAWSCCTQLFAEPNRAKWWFLNLTPIGRYRC